MQQIDSVLAIGDVCARWCRFHRGTPTCGGWNSSMYSGKLGTTEWARTCKFLDLCRLVQLGWSKWVDHVKNMNCNKSVQQVYHRQLQVLLLCCIVPTYLPRRYIWVRAEIGYKTGEAGKLEHFLAPGEAKKKPRICWEGGDGESEELLKGRHANRNLELIGSPR